MRRAERAFGVAVALVGAGALAHAATLSMFSGGAPGPGLFPLICSAVLVVLGAILVWQTFGAGVVDVRAVGAVAPVESRRRHLSTHGDTAPDIRRPLAIWAGYLACVPLLALLGFRPAMMLLLTYLFFVIERRRTLLACAAILFIPLAIYSLFSNVLGIDLPEGTIDLVGLSR